MTGQAETPWDGPEGPAPSAAASWLRPPAVLRTLIVGAGRAGRALARDLRDAQNRDAQNTNNAANTNSAANTANPELRPIGFLDDARDPFAAPDSFAALPLLGTLADLPRLVAEHHAEAVVLAIPGLPTPRLRELTTAATNAGAVVRYLPWHSAVLTRDPTASDLRPLDLRALIDGPALHTVSPEVKEIVTGKRVLVTGAAGTLGAEISRHLHAFNPGDLFLLDSDASALHDLCSDLYATPLATDLSDRDQTDRTFRDLRPEIVFHAAGLRHAPVLERRPSLGVKANVLSTDNLVRAAARHGAERFIRISADADPASMLGASQRAAEALLRAAASKSAKKHTSTVYAAVRVGDVLDARTSLLTVLADQIRAGGPVTVTHPNAARRFATVEEAVPLALEAARLATGGEVYTLDVGEPVRITEVIARFTRQYKLPAVPIRYVGAGITALPPATADADRTERIPTAQPQIFTTPATTNLAEHPALADHLDKLYKAAAKNRDPKVRQMLARYS